MTEFTQNEERIVPYLITGKSNHGLLLRHVDGSIKDTLRRTCTHALVQQWMNKGASARLLRANPLDSLALFQAARRSPDPRMLPFILEMMTGTAETAERKNKIQEKRSKIIKGNNSEEEEDEEQLEEESDDDGKNQKQVTKANCTFCEEVGVKVSETHLHILTCPPAQQHVKEMIQTLRNTIDPYGVLPNELKQWCYPQETARTLTADEKRNQDGYTPPTMIGEHKVDRSMQGPWEDACQIGRAHV